MLKHLSVQNYALIDKLDLSIPEGLNIITGETGAGKSILLGALGLVLGERADSGVLQDKTKKCIVESTFFIKGYKLKSFFESNELDYADETVIRREVNPEGKSRAFINDTPTTLAVLKELSEKLIDIHSQHQTLTLNNSIFQLDVVDAYAKNEALLVEYKIAFNTYRKALKQLEELKASEAQSKKDLDYYQFLFTELDEAGLKPSEQLAMEQELETLNNSEEIKQNLSAAFRLVDGGEINILSSLTEVKSLLGGLVKYNAAIKELYERVNSTHIELKDIASELESLEEQTAFDPKRIQDLSTRLDTIYRLQKKHQVKTVEELIVLRDSFSEKLNNISTLEDQIKKLSANVEKLKSSLMQQAEKLDKLRKGAIPGIEKEIKKILDNLGMPNAVLQINISNLSGEQLNETGFNKVNFLFSANKGGDFKELHKVASGGELSRLMLSIKSIIARLTNLPAIIFDEIDTGVSGDVANKVGGIMEGMGRSMQVIAITHLPQIASKGDSHFFVYKEIKDGKTFSRIKLLNKEERIQEIAKMLSSEKPTKAAIENAKELLSY